jgi:hypothetical protein
VPGGDFLVFVLVTVIAGTAFLARRLQTRARLVPARASG